MVANFTWNPGNEYDIIASHSLWNAKEVDKVIQKPSVKFTLLRDPVHAFESGFIYMGLGTDINKYAQEVQNKIYPSRVPKGMKIKKAKIQFRILLHKHYFENAISFLWHASKLSIHEE